MTRMIRLRLIGGAMSANGATMLALLGTPARDWALRHSIAHVTSVSDRRVGNTIDGAVDLPMAVTGSIVMMLAGLWFLILVPWVLDRWRDRLHAARDLAGATAGLARDVRDLRDHRATTRVA